MTDLENNRAMSLALQEQLHGFQYALNRHNEHPRNIGRQLRQALADDDAKRRKNGDVVQRPEWLEENIKALMERIYSGGTRQISKIAGENIMEEPGHKIEWGPIIELEAAFEKELRQLSEALKNEKGVELTDTQMTGYKNSLIEIQMTFQDNVKAAYRDKAAPEVDEAFQAWWQLLDKLSDSTTKTRELEYQRLQESEQKEQRKGVKRTKSSIADAIDSVKNGKAKLAFFKALDKEREKTATKRSRSSSPGRSSSF
jgi:hypothetical protein